MAEPPRNNISEEQLERFREYRRIIVAKIEELEAQDIRHPAMETLRLYSNLLGITIGIGPTPWCPIVQAMIRTIREIAILSPLRLDQD